MASARSVKYAFLLLKNFIGHGPELPLLLRAEGRLCRTLSVLVNPRQREVLEDDADVIIFTNQRGHFRVKAGTARTLEVRELQDRIRRIRWTLGRLRAQAAKQGAPPRMAQMS